MIEVTTDAEPAMETGSGITSEGGPRSGGAPARFARFLLTGGFNAATCVLFTGLASVMLSSPVAAFVLGYASSLTLSYVVNASFVFRARVLVFAQFWRFCLSYVPNFTVQLVLVRILTGPLGLAPVVASALAVAAAVPLTFLLLSVWTFRPQPHLEEVARVDPAS